MPPPGPPAPCRARPRWEALWQGAPPTLRSKRTVTHTQHTQPRGSPWLTPPFTQRMLAVPGTVTAPADCGLQGVGRG